MCIRDSYNGFVALRNKTEEAFSAMDVSLKKRYDFCLLYTSKDVGTMLEGEEAVKEGLIDEVGGMKEALSKLYRCV